MADDKLYDYSDEDNDEDACWTERLTGGNRWH